MIIKESKLKDSGGRRLFDTGAVRDIQEGKGRCDLMPIDVIADLVPESARPIMQAIGNYLQTGNPCQLLESIKLFVDYIQSDIFTALLELSKHYEDGCNKYGERNWEKGIPLHCYIDSGIRHLLKYLRGDTDEPHDRAFIWNMVGAIWLHSHRSDLIDMPFGSDNPINSDTVLLNSCQDMLSKDS